MQEPFCSVPLIWIIQEDTLAKRLPLYTEMGWKHLVSHWKSVFSRANVVVFPDFTLPVNLPPVFLIISWLFLILQFLLIDCLFVLLSLCFL